VHLACWAVAAAALANVPELDEGRALYLHLELGKAVERLQGAVAKLDAAFAETGDFAPLGEALTLLAASQLGLKDEAGARAAFLKLLELRPSFELDVNVYGPKVAEAFERARTAFRERPRATLELLSDPEATAIVDGVPRGKTRLKISELVVGRHAVRLDAPGHAPWWGSVDLAVGGSSYARTLAPLPGAEVPTVASPPPAVQHPLPAGPVPKRLHAYAAPFLDVVHPSAGGEVGASFSLLPQLDLVASTAAGRTWAVHLGALLGTARSASALRPFAQLRVVLVPLKSQVAVGGSLWLGASLELGPGRVMAGLCGEGYAAPAGYAPLTALVLAGYELDVL
jgi:hypothetical protein